MFVKKMQVNLHSHLPAACQTRIRITKFWIWYAGERGPARVKQKNTENIKYFKVSKMLKVFKISLCKVFDIFNNFK